MKKNFLLSSFFISAVCFSQSIIYSPFLPAPDKNIQYEIIGKVGNSILVGAIGGSKIFLNIYDGDMKMKERVRLDFIPDTLLDIKFIAYPDFCNVIFQTMENGKVYCKGIQLNESGRSTGEIKQIDSIKADALYGAAIYAITISENKKHILLNRSLTNLKPDALQRDELVLNENMVIEKNDHYFIPFIIGEQFLSNVEIDNNGNVLYFTWELPQKDRTNCILYNSPANGSELEIKNLSINKYALRNPLIKINNEKKVYQFISFYKSLKTGDTKGLISIILKNDLSDYTAPQVIPFTNAEKKVAEKEGLIEQAFNGYLLSDIILIKDGGFVVTASTLRNVRPYVRPKFRNHTNFSETMPSVHGYSEPSGYIFDNRVYTFPSLPPPTIPGNKFNNNDTLVPVTQKGKVMIFYPKGNVMTFSFDNKNHHYNTNSFGDFLPGALLSYYTIMILDKQAIFIYNNLDKKQNKLLNNLSLMPDGATMLNPVFSDVKGYDFFPEQGEQVEKKTIIIPCNKDHRFAFAKITFD